MEKKQFGVHFLFDLFIVPIRQETVLMDTSVLLAPDIQIHFHASLASSGMTRMDKLVWNVLLVTTVPLWPHTLLQSVHRVSTVLKGAQPQSHVKRAHLDPGQP